MVKVFRWLLVALFFAMAQVQAQQIEESFVESNILGIFYHELGHALIDIEDIPIFAQEEDAADVFSIYMIDSLFEEETAVALAYDAAFGFIGEADLRQKETDEIPWWDTHGPDEQRFYNTVCIFYGADPEARHDFAADLGLPEERADMCPVEFEQADKSWGKVLDKMVKRGPGKSIRFVGKEGYLADTVLKEEIASLNAELSLAQPLTVIIESCKEANAFYDPEASEIVFCTEFEQHLRGLQNILAQEG